MIKTHWGSQAFHKVGNSKENLIDRKYYSESLLISVKITKSFTFQMKSSWKFFRTSCLIKITLWQQEQLVLKEHWLCWTLRNGYSGVKWLSIFIFMSCGYGLIRASINVSVKTYTHIIHALNTRLIDWTVLLWHRHILSKCAFFHLQNSYHDLTQTYHDKAASLVHKDTNS